jgi:hypothetical protein
MGIQNNVLKSFSQKTIWIERMNKDIRNEIHDINRKVKRRNEDILEEPKVDPVEEKLAQCKEE